MRKLLIIATLSLAIGAQTVNPMLSEVEQLKYRLLVSESQNIALTEAALLQRKKDHEEAVQKFVAGVAAAHPGFRLGENGTLVAIPAETKPKQ